MSVSTVYDDVVANVYEEDLNEDKSEDPQQKGGAQLRSSGIDAEHSSGCQSSANNSKPIASSKTPVVKHRAQPSKRPYPHGDEPEEKLSSLRRQIEYYFSDKNLSSDAFFHEKISSSPEGWLDASWILGCNRVKKMKVTNDAEIESALADSDLEVQWLFGEDSSGKSSKSLQVRRKSGRALPPLRSQEVKDRDGKTLAHGWLAKELSDRRAVAVAAPEPEVEVPEVGATVRLIAGEHSGESGQVMAVDGEELTLLVGGDVVVVSASEVKK